MDGSCISLTATPSSGSKNCFRQCVPIGLTLDNGTENGNYTFYGVILVDMVLIVCMVVKLIVPNVTTLGIILVVICLLLLSWRRLLCELSLIVHDAYSNRAR